ncbi:methyltransferase domain-containing protein [Nucisporomicrobium flavum]|uniref:methyltransferase domain-containing protein n=1 Tax=Nucisporomicrobium flavum TaxID=2785915 RepID=UPI0018F2ECA7|nr:methyltransferase domain-containing protein [Nucisporomicrobium flavum]
MTAAARDRTSAYWSAAAAGWIRHADRHDAWGRPLGATALAALRPAPGERFLDVGCACGGTTAELASVAGPAGAAVGVDLVEALITEANRRFPAAPGRNLSFHTADVERIERVPQAPFDAAYSRMALMMFADPVAGCAAVRRSLRPGGRLAATVFRGGGAPWLPAAMLGAAADVGPVEPLPVGDEPGPFAFADPRRVERILAAAGFTAIAVRPDDVVVGAPDDPEAVADWLIDLGPAGVAYRAAPAGARAAAREGAARLLERYRTPGTGYRLPTAIWTITAERPATPGG